MSEQCVCGHVHPAPTVYGPIEAPVYDYSCGECACEEHEDANELLDGDEHPVLPERPR